MDVQRDSVRYGIRGAKLRIAVNDQEITIGSGNYNLPATVGKVKIDCPLLKEITASSQSLKELATTLENSMAGYKLEGDTETVKK